MKNILLIALCMLLTLASFAQANKWEGNYQYEEVAKATAPMFMDWKLSVMNKAGKMQGVLAVSGQTTYFKYVTDVVPTATGIKLLFNKQTDGPVYAATQPKAGELLFTLNRDGGKLVTQWVRLTPQFGDHPPKTCRCFIRK